MALAVSRHRSCSCSVLLFLFIIISSFLFSFPPPVFAQEASEVRPEAEAEAGVLPPQKLPAAEDLDPLIPPPKCPDNTALIEELHRAKGKLIDLERSLSEKDIALEDKLKVVSALEEEFEKLKAKETADLDSVEKELGSKVTNLEDELRKTDIELQKHKEKANALEAASASHSSKIKQLEKLVSEQKTKIAKAEKALHMAELTLAKVQEDIDAKEKELRKVHGGWLPPWIVRKASELEVYWTRHAQPLVDSVGEKASQKAFATWKSSKPYIENLRSHVQKKWNPVIKQSMESVTSVIGPHIQTAKLKVAEGYKSVVDLVSPHLEKVHDTAKPHLEAVKEISMPYIEKAAAFLQPYYDQLDSITKPYRTKVFKAYREFLTSATAYHSQLQVSVQGTLKKIDILAPLASNELAWFLASALLFLPMMMLSVFFSSLLGPKKKPVKVSKNHGHRKPKRAKQADK